MGTVVYTLTSMGSTWGPNVQLFQRVLGARAVATHLHGCWGMAAGQEVAANSGFWYTEGSATLQLTWHFLCMLWEV